MRVHNISASSNRKWQLMLAASLLVAAVLAWAGIDSKGVKASETNPVTFSKQQVVIVHRELAPDRLVAAADIRVEFRPVGSVPTDSLGDPQLIIGKRPVAHLAVGMPLTVALFAEANPPEKPGVINITEHTMDPEPAVVAEDPAIEAAKHEPEIATAERPEARAKGRGFSSYVWVNGAPMTFGVDEDGSLLVVDRLGNVMPLEAGRKRSSGGR